MRQNSLPKRFLLHQFIKYKNGMSSVMNVYIEKSHIKLDLYLHNATYFRLDLIWAVGPRFTGPEYCSLAVCQNVDKHVFLTWPSQKSVTATTVMVHIIGEQ